MSDKPLDCVGTSGPIGKHDFKAHDKVTAAALGILLGARPHGESESVVDNWRIKMLAEAIRDQKTPEGA